MKNQDKIALIHSGHYCQLGDKLHWKRQKLLKYVHSLKLTTSLCIPAIVHMQEHNQITFLNLMKHSDFLWITLLCCIQCNLCTMFFFYIVCCRSKTFCIYINLICCSKSWSIRRSDQRVTVSTCNMQTAWFRAKYFLSHCVIWAQFL